MSLSREGQVFRSSRNDIGWTTQRFASMTDDGQQSFHQVIVWPTLHLVLVASSTRVSLICIRDGQVLCELYTENMVPRSLRSLLNGPRNVASTSPALLSVLICYTQRISGECVMQTYSPLDGTEIMTFDRPDEGGKDLAECAQKAEKRVEAPGAWELLDSAMVVGVRRRLMSQDPRNSHSQDEAAGLRHRFPHKSNGTSSRTEEVWEMWTASSSVESESDESRPLIKTDESLGQLIVPSIGPRAVVGLTSVAFGFGNVVKLVTIGGQQRFETPKNGNQCDPWQSASRRRKSGVVGRARSGS